MHGRQPSLRFWSSVSSLLLVRVLGVQSFQLIGSQHWCYDGKAYFGNSTPISFTSNDEERRIRESNNTWDEGPKIVRDTREGKSIKGAVQLLGKRGVQANLNFYARRLQQCVLAKSLAEGKKVHDHMRSAQFKPDIYLNNMLISMYSKCGSIEDANNVFQAMEDKDVVSWNAMISGYALHGRDQEAADLFYQMQREGLKPNQNTFISILSACQSPIALEFGEQIHSRIAKAGYESDVNVSTALINMYCKCGSLELARKVFNEMRERNVVSWTAMISGYVQHGDSREALALFRKLIRSGIQPNKVSFASILGACTNPNDLGEGLKLHAYIKQAGLEQEVLVGNALISMYSRCGSLANARQVFDNLRSLNRTTWNAMIAGYGEGLMEEAFRLFRAMEQKGFQPDKFTYASLLAICADRADLDRGKELHSQIASTGWQTDLTVATALISMYAKCGSPEEARKVFNQMPERNVISWNAFISCCCRHDLGKEAFQAFKQMRRDDVNPDHITFITLLNSCTSPEDLERGRYIHGKINQWGMLSNNHVANALISMYGRCGNLADAREVFYRIRRRDLGSWNAMIAANVQHGANGSAFDLFRKYRSEGGKGDKYTFINVLRAVANLEDLDAGRMIHGLVEKGGFGKDIRVLTTLIKMYSKCGSLRDAENVFSTVQEKDVVCWNAMLAAYAHSDRGQDALKLFQQMQLEGVNPDSSTYSTALNACARLTAVEHGKKIHAQLKEAGMETDTRVSNSLIEMYSRCGCLCSAKQVFEKMLSRDINSWNALIAGYCQNGQGNIALEYYELMLRASIVPNKATFTSILSSYAQLGEEEQAFDFLESIKKEWNMEPSEQHYAYMVAALGRAGLLKEAEEFIEEISAESAALMWESLLVACRIHLNVELAETAVEHLLDAKAQASPAVCEQLMSIYAAAGRWEDVSVLKTTMQEAGLVALKSCTIEVNSEFHNFIANHLSPQIGVQCKIEELVRKMTDRGFSLDPQYASNDSREKECLFFQCPELLAVAYGLEHTASGVSIRCVTDSRVTDPSHEMLKFISRAYDRGILVRDPNCFHIFEDGICSCGDYW
uniref:Pentatricopeptide repeat protein 43 n=1 Tax=Funaria hygrometrica TaxID=29583 RepID=F5CAD7_FUNHY|nr:pentatricopeptide repeat protein 43 [Funaria hygrometrica]